MTKPWQIWLVLIAIFATGVAGGWLAAAHVARYHSRRPPPPEVWIARQLERVADEVQLTPEQKERIKPVVSTNIAELIKLRRQAIDVLDRMGKQIAAELTPEQRVKYEKILQERREARHQAQEMRDARRRAGGPPGPGGPPQEPDDRPPPPPPEKSSGT
jgi:Spy/CpxP family protein refolding chaperone